MRNDYYTYAYLREDGTPYYIGKGKGNRAWDDRHRRGAKTPKDKNRILILKRNLSNEEAVKHEIYMIAVLGRKDLGTGILWNFTDGGDGTPGRVSSEKTRKKLSEGVKRSVANGTHSGFNPDVTRKASDRLSELNKKLYEEGKHPSQKSKNRRASAERCRKKFKGAKRWVNREGVRKFQHEKPEGEWQEGMKWKEVG